MVFENLAGIILLILAILTMIFGTGHVLLPAILIIFAKLCFIHATIYRIGEALDDKT